MSFVETPFTEPFTPTMLPSAPPADIDLKTRKTRANFWALDRQFQSTATLRFCDFMLPLLLRRRAILDSSCSRYTRFSNCPGPAISAFATTLRRVFAAIAICDDSSASRQCDSSHKARLPCRIAHVPSAHAHAHAPSLLIPIPRKMVSNIYMPNL